MCEHRRVMAVASVGGTIIDLVEKMPRAHVSDQPYVLMVLSSERMTFYEYVYGEQGLHDQLEQYGTTFEPVYIPGEHFNVVSRCISDRAPEFTRALTSILDSSDMLESEVYEDACEDMPDGHDPRRE